MVGARGLRSIGGFFLIPVISGAAALLAIPLLIRAGGTEGWAAVAIAQGVGATAALAVMFGYGTVGPTEVSRAEPAHRTGMYWDSVVLRGLLLLVALPAALAVTGALAPGYLAAALTVCAAVTVQGMSPGWYLTGLSKPLAVAAMETIPRAAAVLLSVVLVALTENLVAYGVSLLVTECAISVFAFARLARRPEPAVPTRARLRKTLTEQWPVVLSALVGAGYTRAAVPIIAAVAPTAVPAFAALDRIQQFARTAVRPLSMFFQGWVVRHGTSDPTRRATQAALATAAGGFFLGLGVAVFLPLWGHLLFTDAIAITWAMAALTGTAVFAVSCSMATGLYFLVPMRALRVFTWTSVGGTLVGVPMLIALTTSFGATGAIAAVTIVEVCVVLAQTSYIWVSTRGS